MSRGLAAMIALASSLSALPAQAGPWTKSAGEVYVKAGEGLFLSDSYVDSNGQVQEGTKYRGYSTFLYAEAGIWDELHLQLYAPYTVASNSFDDGDRFTRGGIGDLTLGVQTALPVDPGVFAARLTTKLPLYDVGGYDGPDPERFPALGDGQIDLTLWLSAGGGIPGTTAYAYAEAGYRVRTNATPFGSCDACAGDFADSLVFQAQAGWMFFERLLVGVNASATVPFANDDISKGYLTAGPSLYVLVWQGLAVEASVDPVLWARSSARGVGVSFGLSYRRSPGD